MTPQEATSGRPAVSVVMPFYGHVEEAREALDALESLSLRLDDELVISDNSPDRSMVTATASGEGKATVVNATDQFGSYYARNAGAERARADWLLFLDADCIPPPDLIDRYFRSPPGPSCGILAGGVVGAPGQSAAVARWFRSRSALQSEVLTDSYEKKMGVTANMLVRRAAWEAVGGFQEQIRSHGDTEFSWRVQEAGWDLEHLPEAAVEHVHRESLAPLARVSARYGAGASWLNRRRPRSCPRPQPVRGLARCAVAVPILAITGRFERALFKLIDAVAISATSAGYLTSNRPPERAQPAEPVDVTARTRTAIVCDSFPVLAETFITSEAHALADEGLLVRIEAVRRPERPSWESARGLSVDYIEDESYLRRIDSLLAVVIRHPWRSLRDLLTRRRYPAGERVPLVSLAPMVRRLDAWGAQHLHAHFATGAAVTAARVGRFLGIPHSVTAHAFEIFKDVGALRAKLDGAAFVTTGCDYNRRYLLDRVGNPPPVHEIVMGVDALRFRREAPYPGGRRVLAVGRLVQKKGFADLIDATALLEDERPLDRLAIVGEGPMRGELERQIEARGLGDRVELLGAMNPDQVREELERADLLAMPCVVAPDGDRDSMPVVVKEAMAMEIPVVGTEEVGLPELVRPEFGRLATPGNPQALAAAIAELLSLDASERSRMGAAGRAWVEAHASVTLETRKLARLIEGTDSAG
jgi:glycosyltransferase involved in cell wall biosynthesis/GT2 family glycosyltransferase